jgi:hypothetical protein
MRHFPPRACAGPPPETTEAKLPPFRRRGTPRRHRRCQGRRPRGKVAAGAGAGQGLTAYVVTSRAAARFQSQVQVRWPLARGRDRPRRRQTCTIICPTRKPLVQPPPQTGVMPPTLPVAVARHQCVKAFASRNEFNLLGPPPPLPLLQPPTPSPQRLHSRPPPPRFRPRPTRRRTRRLLSHRRGLSR